MRYSSVYLTLTAATLTLAAPKYEFKSETTSTQPSMPQYSPYPKSKDSEVTGYSRHGMSVKPSGTGPRYYTSQVTTTSCATGTAIGGTASGYPGTSSGGSGIFPIPSYTDNEPSGSSTTDETIYDSTSYEPTPYQPTTYEPILPSTTEEETYVPTAPATSEASVYQPSLPTRPIGGPSCPAAPTVTATAYVTLTQVAGGGYIPATSLAGDNGGYLGSTNTGYDGYLPGPSTTEGYGGTGQTPVPDAPYPGTYDVSSSSTSTYDGIPTSSYTDILTSSSYSELPPYPTETPSKSTNYVPGGGYTWNVPGSNGGGYGGSTGFATGTGHMTGTSTTCTNDQPVYPTGTGVIGTGFTYSRSSSQTYSASGPIGTGGHSIVHPTILDNSATEDATSTPISTSTTATSSSSSSSDGYRITLTPIVDATSTKTSGDYTKSTATVESYSNASPPILIYSANRPKDEHIPVPTTVVDSTVGGGYLAEQRTSTASRFASHSTTEVASHPKETLAQY